MKCHELEEALKFYAWSYSWKSTSVYMCGHNGDSRATIDGGSCTGEQVRKKMNKYIFNVGDNSWSVPITIYATSIDGACDQFTEKFATAMGMADLTADNILSVEEYAFG